MRILHISSAKTYGSAERQLVGLCRGLMEKGHDVFVGLRPTNEWQDRLDFIPAQNFLRISIRNSFGMFSSKKIARFIEREKLEIVHAHVARDYLAASVASRIAGTASLLLTRHVLFPLKPFHRFALRNVEAAIAVSPAVGVELKKIFLEEKVFMIPNGIDINRGSTPRNARKGEEFRTLHSIPFDEPLVVTIGELEVLKGQRDFVLAAHEIAKRFPDCRFVIAGKDNSIDKKFRRELKRLVKVFRLEDRFLWLDWLDDIAPLLDAAAIFVSPSHSESFGLAILDAMAAGRAVVATETEGARELLCDPELLTPVKDPLKLAGRIMDLLEDEAKRTKLGANLRLIARESFGLERMVDATEGLYNAVRQKR